MNTIEQRTESWFAQRLGKATASRINDVMARLKSGGEAASRRNYRAQLVCERLTGKKEESFCNSAMQWGIDNEEPARLAYEFMLDHDVATVGFIDHPTIAMTGASPDGHINADGMIEVKCPNTANHIDWMLEGNPPTEHQNQMLWQMECAGRSWCDFVSYDPRLPAELQLFVVRFHRDEERILTIRNEVAVFLSEVDATVTRLKMLTANKLQKAA